MIFILPFLWWLSGLISIWVGAFFIDKDNRPETLTVGDIIIATLGAFFGLLIPLFYLLAIAATWIEDKKILKRAVWRRKE